jgi:cytochrome c-type biogenesis protein CcmE
MKSRTLKYLIIGIVISGLLVTAVWMFVVSVTPYTQDFDVARSGDRVQAWGKIDSDSISGNSFKILDKEGDSLPVMVLDQLPPNIEQADSCVVSGRWKNDVFVADKVLVKCPSKYSSDEGTDE